MGVISEIVGNEAPGFAIEHKGRRFVARLIDQAAKAEFEQWLFERDLTRLDATKRFRPAEEHQAKLAEAEAAFDAGDYELLSPRGLKEMQTRRGALRILGLIFQRGENELIGLLADRKAETLRLVARMVRLSFPGLELPLFEEDAEGSADPNG